MSLLDDVREIAECARGVRDAMQTGERPSAEDCGIAFVCAEAILDITDRLDLDLIAAELADERVTA